MTPFDTFLKQINSNINQILLNIESESNIDKSDNSKCKEDDCKITFKDVCGIFNKEGELKENFIKVCDNYNTFYDILISPEQINDFCSKNLFWINSKCIILFLNIKKSERYISYYFF